MIYLFILTENVMLTDRHSRGPPDQERDHPADGFTRSPT